VVFATGNAGSNSASPFELKKKEPAEDLVEKEELSATTRTQSCDHSLMYLNGHPTTQLNDHTPPNGITPSTQSQLIWSWPIEHEDRQKERNADAASHNARPFEVDRKILKDVVRERMGVDVGRIRFMSAGESKVSVHQFMSSLTTLTRRYISQGFFYFHSCSTR
jgi:hypothetical protein